MAHGSRPGGQTDWRGPHLPDKPRDGDEIGEPDPARGERVARCLCCGQPEVRGNRLIVFGLQLYGRGVGAIRLCERDYRHANPFDPP